MDVHRLKYDQETVLLTLMSFYSVVAVLPRYVMETCEETAYMRQPRRVRPGVCN